MVVSTVSRLRMARTVQIFTRKQATDPTGRRSQIAIGWRFLDKIVPRYRFGSSVYSTPILLVLRLFYGAASFDASNMQGLLLEGRGSLPARSSAVTCSRSLHRAEPSRDGHVKGLRLPKISVAVWAYRVLSLPVSGSIQLVSLTWVKGLASNLSHEYIQFVVFDPTSNTRNRFLVDRQDDGDYIFMDHDWTSYSEPSPSHSLPLPLLSLSFGDCTCSDRPSLSDFARIVTGVSQYQPEYDPLKFMCWWYAETILGEVLAAFGGTLKEWDYAKLRYSLVVRSNVLRRKKLTACAERFRAMNA